MTDKELRVTIEGTSASGKSHLMAIFNRALKEAGFTDVTLQGYDEHHRALLEKASDGHVEYLKKEDHPLLHRRITMIERHVRRDAPQ
jgi:thymidylate kinase